MRQIAAWTLVAGLAVGPSAGNACGVIRPQFACEGLRFRELLDRSPDEFRHDLEQARRDVAFRPTSAGFRGLIELLEVAPLVELTEDDGVDYDEIQGRFATEKQRAIREWVRLFPNEPSAHVPLAGELEWERREDALHDLVRRFPDSLEVQMALASELVETGREGEALSLASAATARRPVDPEALHFHIEFLQDAGRAGLALPLLQRWIEVAPSDGDAWFHYLAVAGSLVRPEEYSEALDRFLSTRPSFLRRIEACAQASQARKAGCLTAVLEAWNPDVAPAAQLELVFVQLLEVGAWDEAARIVRSAAGEELRPRLQDKLLWSTLSADRCDLAREIAPAGPALEEDLRFEMTVRCGESTEREAALLGRLANSDDAELWMLSTRDNLAPVSSVVLAEIDRRLVSEPTSSELWRVRLSLSGEDPSSRREILHAWIDSDPHAEYPLRDLAELEARAGNLALAAELSEQAWSLGGSEPNEALTTIDRLLAAGRLEHLAELADTWLGSPEPASSLGAYAAARLAEARGDLETAIAMARFVARDSNLQATASDLEASALYSLGRIEEARERLVPTANLPPELAVRFRGANDMELAERSLRLGLTEIARVTYRDLLRDDPEDPAAWLGLALSELAADQKELAEAALRQAIAINPRAPEARHELAKILVDGNRLGEALDLLASDAISGWYGLEDALGALADRAGEIGAPAVQEVVAELGRHRKHAAFEFGPLFHPASTPAPAP